MRDVDDALAWLERQRTSGSTAWHNLCESLCRQAYGLPAHYPSAEAHARAVPSTFRHGHEAPRAGDLMLMMNGGAGHIVICTGRGWQAYTNDYGGRGRVTLVADARDLVRWCGASSWFVADAWWSSSNYLRTHTAPAPPVTQPPAQQPPADIAGDDGMAFIVSRKIGQPGDGKILCDGGRMVGLVKSSWDASPAVRALPTLEVTDPGQWQRLVAAYGPPA